ncbi:MAG: histidine phosphatase family protein [Anaerolineaceae bacterium]|nr:histidine phosphatase family protein [Anaerolineaceae bacterium]MBN2678302.1 histidine phosphatase family protein [Anaerolineaceae bacterium]
MRFIFTRHGESISNTKKIMSNRDETDGLTALGIQQAEMLAGRLSTENIVQLYTSPILRARQTSRILAEELDIPVIAADALREPDYGSLEGRSDKESWTAFVELFKDWMQGLNRDVAIGGGECFDDIFERFMPFMQGLISTTAGEKGSLLLVSHGGVLFTMLPLLLENINYAFAGSREMTNTGIVIADENHGRLFCREWCGEPVKAS